MRIDVMNLKYIWTEYVTVYHFPANMLLSVRHGYHSPRVQNNYWKLRGFERASWITTWVWRKIAFPNIFNITLQEIIVMRKFNTELMVSWQIISFFKWKSKFLSSTYHIGYRRLCNAFRRPDENMVIHCTTVQLLENSRKFHNNTPFS